MPQSVVTKERFDEVVAILEKRARHLLAREGRLGSGTRFSSRSRIADDELLVRVQRLQQSFAELKQGVSAIREYRPGLFERHEIWPQTIEIETALSYDRFSNLADDDVEARLLRSHNGFKAIRSQLDSVLQKKAEQIGPTLARLTQEEIKILADTANDDLMEDGDFRIYPKDALDLIADLTGLINLADASVSEARYVLTGRFDPWKGPGRPTSRRGDRLSAQLLGIAEGMNLRLSRGKKSPPHSAADAVAEALARCTDVKDPASLAILEEAPKKYHAIVRRLTTKFEKSELLSKDRALGQAFSRRLEDRT
jgi:hypothetical protein